MGFSDFKIAELTKSSEDQIYKLRNRFNIFPNFFKVDTCAGEFKTDTSYLYSSYEIPYQSLSYEKENIISEKKKVIILGGGPVIGGWLSGYLQNEYTSVNRFPGPDQIIFDYSLFWYTLSLIGLATATFFYFLFKDQTR